MNRKFNILTLICFLILALAGCSSINMEVTKKIKPPANNKIPIQGTWKISDMKALTGSPDKSEDKYMGSKAIFDNSIAVIGDDACINAQYKIRSVNTKDFLLYTYKTDDAELKLSSSTSDIISISSEGKPFYECIKVSDNELLVSINNNFYFLNKISDSIDASIKTSALSRSSIKGMSSERKEDDLLRSGILLGLQYAAENKLSYRTLWIASNNRSLHPLLTASPLFLPRRSGIWRLEINNDINAYPVEAWGKSLYKGFSGTLIKPGNQKNTIKNITFLSNDYISVETFSGGLNVYPIDSMLKQEGIKITDIAGEQGRSAMTASAKSVSRLDIVPEESSFAVMRRNGHWILKGRLNNRDGKNENVFLDYNISIPPPSKLVCYDELYISWNSVKEKVPDAVDVYTSPNKDIALIMTKSHIYVYSINKNTSLDKLLKKVKIQEGENIIMAEWATGVFVEKWENILKEYGSPY